MHFILDLRGVTFTHELSWLGFESGFLTLNLIVLLCLPDLVACAGNFSTGEIGVGRLGI